MRVSDSLRASKSGTAKQRVTVESLTAPAVAQGDDFVLCPLGLQFHSEEMVEPFTVMSVEIEVPDEAGGTKKISCTGAVVRCQPDKENKRHRVWIQFLDVPGGAREQLRCTAKTGNFLCTYCENF